MKNRFEPATKYWWYKRMTRNEHRLKRSRSASAKSKIKRKKKKDDTNDGTIIWISIPNPDESKEEGRFELISTKIIYQTLNESGMLRSSENWDTEDLMRVEGFARRAFPERVQGDNYSSTLAPSSLAAFSSSAAGSSFSAFLIFAGLTLFGAFGSLGARVFFAGGW